MPFLLLLLITVPCLPVQWPPPPPSFDLWGSIAATWGGLALVVSGQLPLTWYWQSRLVRDPCQREALSRQQPSWRICHLAALYGVYLLSIYYFGWGWVVQAGFQPSNPVWPGCELMVLLPFIAGLVASWTIYYDVERALHDAQPYSDWQSPFWSRAAYLSYHMRNHLAMVFIPVLLMVFVNSLPRLLPNVAQTLQAYSGLLGLFFALLAYTCMPWLVRLVLRLTPLSPGPGRDRLEAAARRIHVRCSELMLWNTRGGAANAMVIGLLPWPRYIAFSDRLLSDMSPDEVDAVLGHEAGHIKHRHMLYYMLFLILSLSVVSQLWQLSGLRTLLHLEAEHLEVLPVLTILAIYVFVVFGFLSRRCERQADLYGCRAVSCGRSNCSGHEPGAELPALSEVLCPTGIQVFIDALEKVALCNGMSRDKPGWLQSWLHSTIAKRVAFLEGVRQRPELALEFQRSVGRFKWALVLGLLALGLLLSQQDEWASWLSMLRQESPP